MSATGDKGFTLIEALVIVAVIALISGIVFPGIERLVRGAGYASARLSIAGEAEAARARAFRQQMTVAFEQSEPLPAGVDVSAFPRRILWFGDGTSSGGRIEIASGGRRAVLEISPVTGQLRWKS